MQVAKLTTSDLDEARTKLGEDFSPSVTDVLSPGAEWNAAFTIAPAGLVTVGDLRFRTDRKVGLGDLGAFQVDVPVGGDLVWHQGREPEHGAASVEPEGPAAPEQWDAGCRLLAVKIDRSMLEDELEAPALEPASPGAQPDLSTDAGAGWFRLVQLIAPDAIGAAGPVGHPVLGRRLRESLVAGLILATRRGHRDRPGGRRPTLAAPRAVRRAVEAMWSDPGRPFTVTDLARVAGVSARSLQDSFQRYVHTSPMAYLREVRLSRVHDELRAADPARTTVTEIAYSCGFLHLGRFAATYRRRYGVPPSQTLRR